MSIVAEFARRLQESEHGGAETDLFPMQYSAREEKLYDIRAVIFDVYGTLMNYRKEEFAQQDSKERSLREAFRRVIDFFHMAPYLEKMNPAATPEQTLADFYHGLIALDHQKSRRENIETPEVRIERIWGLIVKMLKRHGYETDVLELGGEADVAKCMAYAYNFWAFARGFFPGVVEALEALKKRGIRAGILSNAQFYTPIDLTLFVREQSEDRYDDFRELFDEDLCFFSYEYGVAKPGAMLFEKLFNVLYEKHILPAQTVFVGNDLAADIKPAGRIGLRTALFCGDSRSVFVHDLAGKVVPDITFESYDELSTLLSFYEEKGKA